MLFKELKISKNHTEINSLKIRSKCNKYFSKTTECALWDGFLDTYIWKSQLRLSP